MMLNISETHGGNLIWKFADQKVNVFGPAHIEKSHFKGVFGCIYWQSFMKYGGNKSYKRVQPAAVGLNPWGQ